VGAGQIIPRRFIMAVKNPASRTILPESKADIQAKLTDIRGKLAFLMSLKGADIQALVKAGVDYTPFLEKAQAAVDAYSDHKSGMMKSNGSRKDNKAADELASMVAQINRLAESVQKTHDSVGSDKMVAALEEYEAKHRADIAAGRVRASALPPEWIAGATVPGAKPKK
jgi:hypothetical protein